MDRIIVTRPFLGICHMQVCAVADATDKEILEVCNSANPSGTSGGWMKVIRKIKKGYSKKDMPGICADHPDRKHFLVSC